MRLSERTGGGGVLHYRCVHRTLAHWEIVLQGFFYYRNVHDDLFFKKHVACEFEDKRQCYRFIVSYWNFVTNVASKQ